MGWVRSGSCPPERCQGRCCQQVGTWFDDTPDARKFMELLQTRGVTVKTYESETERKHLALIDQRCQWLTDDNLCGLHPDMNPAPDSPPRPDICGEWPTEPGQTLHHPHCGFRFEWQPEASEVGST